MNKILAVDSCRIKELRKKKKRPADLSTSGPSL